MRSPMKILLIIRSLDVGGTETQIAQLARGLARRGIDVRIAVFYTGGVIEKQLQTHSIQVTNLNKGGRWDIAMFTLRLRKLIKSYEPDVVYGFLTESNLCALLCKLFSRKVVVAWGVRASISDIRIRKYDCFVLIEYVLAKLLSRFTDLIISNSLSSKQFHEKAGFKPPLYYVIENGVDTDRFRKARDLGEALKRELRIRQETKLIGLVARLDPIKDHKTFIEAASILYKKRSDVMFMCVGTGSSQYQRVLIEEVNRKQLTEAILWLGERNDMVRVYNALEINTLCSLSESFPNSVCEAVSCCVPCVVTDVGDIAAIVGNAGIVIGQKKPDELAAAWSELLDNKSFDREKILDQARERLKNRFGVEFMVDRTIEVLFKHVKVV